MRLSILQRNVFNGFQGVAEMWEPLRSPSDLKQPMAVAGSQSTEKSPEEREELEPFGGQDSATSNC